MKSLVSNKAYAESNGKNDTNCALDWQSTRSDGCKALGPRNRSQDSEYQNLEDDYEANQDIWVFPELQASH
jgi:hypothetical protein